MRLAWTLASGLVVAILVVTSWMAGVAAAIVWMWDEGISWPAAIGIAALINIAAAGALERELAFPQELPSGMV